MEMTTKRRSLNYRLVFNALAFQLVWFLCVQGDNLIALIAASILLLCHHYLYRPRKQEVSIMVQLIIMGIL